MSDEQIGNTGEPTATETESSVESTSTEGGYDLEALHKKAQDRNSGQDRISKALDIAKNGEVKIPEQATVEDLATANLPEGEFKGIDYNRVINELPDDAQKLLSNLRSDYTRKTQQLAQQRKQLEERMAALEQSGFNQEVRELASQEPVELDPYDTKTFEARIEQEVAKRLNQMMEPIREQQFVTQKKAELQEFKNQHPDLLDYKQDIVQVLKARPEMSLQDAYYMIKGQKQSARVAEMEAELSQRKRLMAETGLKLGTPARGADMRPPKGLKGYEIYQWIKNNRK